MTRVSGLWKSKSGKKFMNGRIDKSKLLDLVREIGTDAVVLFVFPNDRKERNGDPDYTLNFAESRPRGWEAKEEDESDDF